MEIELIELRGKIELLQNENEKLKLRPLAGAVVLSEQNQRSANIDVSGDNYSAAVLLKAVLEEV